MTKAVWLRRTLYDDQKRPVEALVPRTAEAYDMLMAVKPSKPCVGDIHGARNPEQLALYWVLCGIVGEALDLHKNAVDDYIRRKLNYVEPYIDPIGRLQMRVLSIAVESMTQDDFNEFFKRATAAMSELMGTTTKELRQRFFDALDGDLKRRFKSQERT